MDSIGQNIEELHSYFPKAKPLRETEKKAFKVQLLRFYFQTIGRFFPRLGGKLALRLFTTPIGRARHRKSDEILERAKVFDFLYGGQLLKGYEWGEGDKTILLVHGWQSRGTALRYFVSPLLRRGYRVVAFDGPAHGNSSGKQTHLAHFAGAVRAIINRLGNVEGIISHSFGGAASMFTIAYQSPQYKIDKLVLLGVPSSLLSAINSFFCYLNLPEGVRKNFIKRIETVTGTPLAQAGIDTIHSKVDVDQVLIVHDTKDEIVSINEARKIVDHWPKAHLVVTEGYGHYKLIKNPDVVGRVVAFFHEPSIVIT